MESEWSIFFHEIVRAFMGANLELSHGMTGTPRSNSFVSGIIQHNAIQGLFVASMDSMDRKRIWIRDNEFVHIYKHGPSPVFLSECLGTSPNELVLSKTMTIDATFGQIFLGGQKKSESFQMEISINPRDEYRCNISPGDVLELGSAATFN